MENLVSLIIRPCMASLQNIIDSQYLTDILTSFMSPPDQISFSLVHQQIAICLGTAIVAKVGMLANIGRLLYSNLLPPERPRPE